MKRILLVGTNCLIWLRASEDIFTAGTQRGKAATKTNRNISRNDAKAQSKKRFPNLAFLAAWREEYPNPRVSRCEKFARLAQILKYSSTKKENNCFRFDVHSAIRVSGSSPPPLKIPEVEGL